MGSITSIYSSLHFCSGWLFKIVGCHSLFSDGKYSVRCYVISSHSPGATNISVLSIGNVFITCMF